ncbi:transport and Golgi organization protein 1-like isoform X2 [Pecten maximus]|uniref:transport and Golgi organization protein 1-like isoform X2 n=1 Tax=Pecten maximus TaxID=6579 RepID=UPI001458F8C7|nr:transport and Golgi organization protein 1-like isoform X2 [Pecten maximus]
MAACVSVERMISRLMFVAWLLTFVIAMVEASTISDLRLCGDAKCERIISYARALGKYRQNDPIFLSFERDDIVRILSKSAGQKPDLWGGEVHGRKGYFPRSFVKEYKVDIPNPQHTVKTQKALSIEERMRMEDEDDTELGDDTEIEDDTELAEEENDLEDTEKHGKEEPVQDTTSKEEVGDDTEVDETELGEEGDDDESTDSTEVSSDTEVESDQDVFDYYDIKAKNILNHISEFDEDIFPILHDEDDEKLRIEELNKILMKKPPTPNEDMVAESASGEKLETTQEGSTISQPTDTTQQAAPTSDHQGTTQEAAPTSDHQSTTQQTAPTSEHQGTTQQTAPTSDHQGTTQQADASSEHPDTAQQTVSTPQHSAHEDKPAKEAKQVKEEEVQKEDDYFDETDIEGDEEEEEASNVLSDVVADLKKVEHDKKEDIIANGRSRHLSEEMAVSTEEGVKDSPKSEDVKEMTTPQDSTKTEAEKQVLIEKSAPQDVQKEEQNNMKTVSDTEQKGHDRETKTLDFVQAQVDDAMKKVETGDIKLEYPSDGVKEMEQPSEENQKKEQPSDGDKEMEQPSEENQKKEQPSDGDKKTEQPTEGSRAVEDMAEGVKKMEQSADGDKKMEQHVEGVKQVEQPAEGVKEMEQPANMSEKKENVDAQSKEVKQVEEPAIKEAETKVEATEVEQPQVKQTEQPLSEDKMVPPEESRPEAEIPVKGTVDEQVLPSSVSVTSATQAVEPDVQPGYTIIDGTPFPLDMLEDTVIDSPSPVMEELKTRIPDQPSSPLDIAPTASFSEPMQTSADPSKLDPSQTSNVDSHSEVPPFQEPVHSNIEESISQHPSFTVSEASSLSSSETTSLSDGLSLSSDTTHGSQSEIVTENLHASVSVSEQLLSSMDVSMDMGEKHTSTEGIVSNRDIVQQNLTHTDSLEVEVPKPGSNQDVYATADFLSRKVLSHDGSQGSMPSTNGQPQNGAGVSQESPDKHVQTEKIAKSDDTNSATQNVDTGTVPNLPTEGDQGVTPPTTDSPNEIPPPPLEEKPTATVPPWQQDTASPDKIDLTGTGGEYNTDSQWSRKINDESIEAQEDKAFQADTWWVRTVRNMDARLKVLVVKLPPSVQSLLEQEPLGLSPQMAIFVTMVMTFILFIVTCCGLLKGKTSKKKDPVLVVRSLEEQLFIMTKEKENLEDDLQSTKQKMTDLEKDLNVHQSSSGDLETDLKNHRLHVDELKQKLGILEQEKEKLTVDIQQKQQDAESEHESAAELHTQIIYKDKMLEELHDLQEKTNQQLSEAQMDIENYASQLQSTTEQVQHLETRKQQLLQEAEGWKENAQDLTERLDLSVLEQNKLQEELDFKQNELEVLRDCFLQLKAFETEENEDTDQIDSESIQEKFRSMLDVSKVKASLHSLEEEKLTLQNKVDIEIECRQEMEEQIACLQAKLESFQADKMKADRQCHESQTKLNVLTHYFKEKEVQLQRELGEQEALKKQNKNKLEHADERSKMVEAELESNRTQVEDLKKEILSAERDFRSQIAANEKKAHENWLAARAAERELKESRHDATALRQKLTELERRSHHGPSGLLRPLPTRGMPPPGMNGPPPPLPPGVDRPGSRGGGPPGPPGIRDGEFLGSPGPERMPPPPMLERRMPPPGVMGPRMPPPLMDGRSPPPYDRRGPPPPDRRSPPPYERGLRMPPPHMDHRSPGYRMPPPDMLPRMRGPPPPHLRGGPTSPPPPHGMGLPPDGSGIHPYHPPPPGPDPDHKPRQQSQV